MTDQSTTPPEELERRLRDDLRALGERLDDADFSGQLYRALASRTWRPAEDGGGHVALSWKRAEEIVNALRAERGTFEELTLAQTGGEGWVSEAVEQELGRLGWRSQPLDTSRHDPAHVDSPEDEPRVSLPEDRFQRAHEAAEEERRARADGPAGSR